MLIQSIDILCTIILREPVDRVLYVVSNISRYYDEFPRYKKDKLGNKRKNKPQYIEKYGLYWKRIINPPRPELKIIQKRINAYLVKYLSIPEYAFGGIRNRDNILNARFHKGHRYVFQTDIKDFFPRITNKMVYEMFVSQGFSPDAASLLTKLTTFKGHLPQGAPTSTTIANLVFVPIGDMIKTIADREGLYFTTFVDDITISSEHDFKDIIPEIMNIITSESFAFKISQGKTTYKGLTDITGVKMHNNYMCLTDNLRYKMKNEHDLSSPRYKGLSSYAARIKKISNKKR